jgi:hypothetical protein
MRTFRDKFSQAIQCTGRSIQFLYNLLVFNILQAVELVHGPPPASQIRHLSL